MNTSAISLEPHDKILLVRSSKQVMTPYLYLKKSVILRKSVVANFTDNIRIAVTLIKTTFQNSTTVKRTTNYVFKCNFYLISYNKNH